MTTHADLERRPLRRDAARNRARLLAAAGQVFDSRGLDASVAEIAAVAGVGMGTLYRHFPTKEALVDALVRDVLEAIIEMAAQALEQPGGTGLEHFLRASAAYQTEHRGCLPRLWSTDHELIRSARSHIARLLTEAKHGGRVREEVTSTDITVIMWSIRGIVEATHELATDAWPRHLEILLAGLRPSAAPLGHPALGQRQVDEILSPST